MITKIVLSLITLFLLVFSLYLVITGKEVEGTYLDGRGFGWVHNSFNGYLLLLVTMGFLVALIYIFRRRKI